MNHSRKSCKQESILESDRDQVVRVAIDQLTRLETCATENSEARSCAEQDSKTASQGKSFEIMDSGR